MAIRTVSNTGGNYNATGTWVEGVVPTSADDVVFTATSGQLTINVASAAKSINFANYTNTITFNQALTVSGNVNLGTGGYTQAGANGIVVNATATLTSGGVTWSRLFTFAGTSITYTLADNWTVTGTVSLNGTTTTIINGNTLNIGANLTVSSAAIISGTTLFNFNGAGTWSSVGGTIRNNFTINTGGTLTLSGTVYYDTGVITYTAGTVVTTGSTILSAASTTFNTNTLVWNNFTTGGTSLTYSLSSNINLGGTFSLNHSGTLGFSTGVNQLVTTGPLLTAAGTTNLPNSITVSNAFILNSATNVVLNSNTIFITGNLNSSGTGIVSGTTNLVLAGTGSWSNLNTAQIRNNLTINTPGTITVTGSVYYNTGTLTYTSGTVVTTGSTLVVGLGTTLATNGVTWFDVNIAGSSNYGITISNNLTMSRNLVFSTTGLSTITLTGNTIFIGGLSVTGNSVTTGTTAVIFNGSGTWSHSSTGNLRNNLTINTAGTLIVSGTVYYNTGTLTYTAGTVVTTGSNLVIGAATTLATNGMTWSALQIGGSMTITLSNNLSMSGRLQHDSGTTVINGNTFFIGGSLRIAQISTGTLGGTSLIVLNGTGTWENNSSTITNNLTINTTGTVSIGTNVFYSSGTLTYTAGTVVTTGSTLNLTSCTLATNGINWNSISTSSATTLILSNNLSLIGTLGIVVNTLSFTLNGNSIISSSASLSVGSGATLNVPQNMTFSNFSAQGTSTISGNQITLLGSLTHGSNFNITGTTQFVLAGTGTVSSTSGGYFTLPLTINTPGTIVISGSFQKGGNFTYVTGSVITTGSSLALGSGTHSLSGISFNNVAHAGGTIQLDSNLVVAGSFGMASATCVMNGSTLFVGGSLTITNGGSLSGTTLIVLNGTGTVAITSGAPTLTNNLTINTAGTITISGNIYYSTGTITYTGGTVITTGSTLNIAAATTFATNGINWNNITITGTTTTTLTNNLTSSGIFSLGSSGTNVLSFTGPGLLILASASVVTNCLTFNVPHNLTVSNLTINNIGIQNFINSFQISVLRNFTNNNLSVGNTTIIMAGTGTFSSPANLRNNLTFNTSGTVFISGSNFFQSGIITYTSGNIVTTGSTLTVDMGTSNATPSLITQGIIWNNINFGVFGSFAPTIVLGNHLTATGTVSLPNSTTFVTSGFTVGRLVLSTAGTTQRFVSGQTYSITDSFACTNSTDASRIILRGSVTASKVNLVLSQTGTQDLGFVNAIDINSNGGKKIYSYKGTFSNTDNWFQLPTTALGGEKIITFSS